MPSPSPKWLRGKPGLPRRLCGGALRPLKDGKSVAGRGKGILAGLAGTWDTFTPTEEKKNHITIGGGTGTHAPPAPGAPRGAPLSTKVPSEAVRETSQVKHSGAEVQVEVKERQ